jgi:hypothetical protein
MDVNRIQIYNASYTWEAKDFNYVGFIVLVITIGATKEIFRFVSRGKLVK